MGRAGSQNPPDRQRTIPTRQRVRNPRWVQCWASVADAGPTLNPPWLNTSCFLWESLMCSGIFPAHSSRPIWPLAGVFPPVPCRSTVEWRWKVSFSGLSPPPRSLWSVPPAAPHHGDPRYSREQIGRSMGRLGGRIHTREGLCQNAGCNKIRIPRTKQSLF